MALVDKIRGILLEGFHNKWDSRIPEEARKTIDAFDTAMTMIQERPIYTPLREIFGLRPLISRDTPYDKLLKFLDEMPEEHYRNSGVPQSLVGLMSLRSYLLSQTYECPLCLQNRKREDVGLITLSWESEHDDAGYPAAWWPTFDGECRDEPRTFTIRGFRSGYQRDFPLNHAEQLNRSIADGEEGGSAVQRILGQAAERRAIAERLLIEVPSWH